MKIAALIARILVAIVFLFFGLNGFLHFLPGQLPPGLAGQFVGAMSQSHYDFFVSGIQVIGGALLLINRYVPFALTILGPVIINILLFHLLLFPIGWQPGVVCAILWIILFIHYRQYFSGLFVQKA
ncbi:MAG: hypothetical protein JO300_07985 [Silvibacterium sp.]|nr:hypothetical protein [Silvibacterium sp.]